MHEKMRHEFFSLKFQLCARDGGDGKLISYFKIYYSPENRSRYSGGQNAS